MNTNPWLAVSALALASLTLTGCSDIVIELPTVYVEQPLEVEEPVVSAVKQIASDVPAVETQLLAQAVKAEATKEDAQKEEPKKVADANPDRNTRPKADRTPRKPGEAIKITFDNIIIGMQADIPYRPWMMNEEVKELEGKRVSITGVMNGIVDKQKNLKSFVLLRNKECKYGKGGQADHLAEVKLKTGQGISFTTDTVRVEGTLRIEPFTGSDGNTWSIYVLDDAMAKVQ